MKRYSKQEKCRNDRRPSQVRTDARQRGNLHFENLEERRLMAVVYDPVSDHLMITGTSAADVVEVAHLREPIGTSYTSVRDNGTTYRFPEATMPVRSIAAILYGGSDYFTIRHDSAVLSADVWEHAFVDTGGGDDVIDVDIRQTNPDSDTTFKLDIRSGRGDDTVRGVLEFSNVLISSIKADTGAGNDRVDIRTNITVEDMHLQHELLIITGAGNDDIQTELQIVAADFNGDSSPDIVTNVLAGDGDDLLRMNTRVTGGQADGFLLHINDQIRLGNGHDRAVIDQIFAGNLDAMSTMMLDVNGGKGNDQIDFGFIAPQDEATGGEFRSRIDGGDGDDSIRAEALLSAGRSRVIIDVLGQAGNDRLWLLTSGDGGGLLSKRLRIDGGEGIDNSWSTDDVQVVNVEQQH